MIAFTVHLCTACSSLSRMSARLSRYNGLETCIQHMHGQHMFILRTCGNISLMKWTALPEAAQCMLTEALLFMHACLCSHASHLGPSGAAPLESCVHAGRGAATKSPVGASGPSQRQKTKSLKTRSQMGTLAWSLCHLPKALRLPDHLL